MLKMCRSQVLISLMVILAIKIGVIRSVPLGKFTFSLQNGDGSEFRDKAFDKEIKKVTYVGEAQVPALESYDNPPDLDNVRKEEDNFPSNVYSKYDNVQKKVKDWLDTEPIIDNIREEDKYGNEGDHFYFITKPLVQFTETVSNGINKVLQAPRSLFKSATKSVSEKLNNVGASFVGLRK